MCPGLLPPFPRGVTSVTGSGRESAGRKKAKAKTEPPTSVAFSWRCCCHSRPAGLCFKNRAGFYKPQSCQNVLRPDCCGCFCNCYVIILITLTMFCSSLVYDGFSCLSGEELCLSWLLHCSYPVHSPLCVAGTQITDGMNEHSLTVLEKRRSCNLLLCSLLPLPSRDKVVSVSAAWGALKAGSFCLLGLRI